MLNLPRETLQDIILYLNNLDVTILLFVSNYFVDKVRKLPLKKYLCETFANDNYFSLLKWAKGNGCYWDCMTSCNSAKNGHLDILKWARKNGCYLNEFTCSEAAHNGHLDVLKWARENGCDWDSDTCSNAAYNGHLDVLKWARDNGCDWDSDTCSNAAGNGSPPLATLAIIIFKLKLKNNSATFRSIKMGQREWL